MPPDVGERSLDVGVVTAINPQSPLVLYAGSGFSQHANADAYTAYQAAFWDTANNPEVVSSSYQFGTTLAAPGSPFLFAVDQLFVDAALRGVTILTSGGDGGSGGWTGDGVTNVVTSRGSPYDLMVGGTSLSTLAAAGADPTLSAILTLAMAGDPATIWDLVAGGLTALPATAGPGSHFVEAVWNTYALSGTTFAITDISETSLAPAAPIPATPSRPTRAHSAWCRRPPTRPHWWAAACRTSPPTPVATFSMKCRKRT